MLRKGCFLVLEYANSETVKKSFWPWRVVQSLCILNRRELLHRAWQKASQNVKIIAFLVICYALSICCLNYAHGQSRNEIWAFWRTVFARPGDDQTRVQIDATSEQIDLGKALFQDRRLSGAQSRACDSCHNPQLGFTDGLVRARGLDGQMLPRNTPTLHNLAWGTSFNLDGSASSLEQQALGPIENPNELGGDFSVILERLRADEKLKTRFAKAFPARTRVSKEEILASLAAYVRSLVSVETKFDSWIGGNAQALSNEEQLGFRLFVGKGGCVGCHVGWRMTDNGFHDIGLPAPKITVTKANAGKRGELAFKTPTLRGVRLTAPYMHDGSQATLDDVVEHYADGVVERRGLSELLQKTIDLSDQERRALIAFLKTL